VTWAAQFAGRSYDQRADRTPALPLFLGGAQSLQYRQGKTGSFTGSGLGAAHHIPAFQDQWDSLPLDGRGYAVSFVGYGTD